MIKSLLYTFRHDSSGSEDINEEINKDLRDAIKIISHKMTSTGGSGGYEKAIAISILIEV